MGEKRKENYMAVLGENIKRELKEKNMTQKELCQKTGITESVMSDYINKNESIRTDALLKIADALDVSVYTLLGVPDKKESAYEICKREITARGEGKLTEEETKELIRLLLED